MSISRLVEKAKRVLEQMPEAARTWPKPLNLYATTTGAEINVHGWHRALLVEDVNKQPLEESLRVLEERMLQAPPPIWLPDPSEGLEGFYQDEFTTLLNRLPVVIDEPGDYVTRSGRKVSIHAIDRRQVGANSQFLRHECTAFEAKGQVWAEIRGKLQPCGYDIWHISGFYGAGGQSPLDIVGKA